MNKIRQSSCFKRPTNKIPAQRGVALVDPEERFSLATLPKFEQKTSVLHAFLDEESDDDDFGDDGMYDDDYNDEFDESIAVNDGGGANDSGRLYGWKRATWLQAWVQAAKR